MTELKDIVSNLKDMEAELTQRDELINRVKELTKAVRKLELDQVRVSKEALLATAAADRTRKDYKDMTGAAVMSAKRATAAEQAAKQTSDLVKGTLVAKAKKDADHIRKAYSCAFLKTIVMTEVINAYSVRKVKDADTFSMVMAILAAYDETDTWWLKQEGINIAQWIEVFLERMKGIPSHVS